MSFVLVVDQERNPLDPVHPGRARFLLTAGHAAVLELVKFDTQLLQNAEISGVEYQQGELAGYEVREYLLEKFQRRCADCGTAQVPFEVEHIRPKARGGSDRISNLAIACHACNEAKGAQTAAEFGHPEVQAQAKMPLKDAAAVNTTRWALYRRLQATGLLVETGTGGARNGTGHNGVCRRPIGWMPPVSVPARQSD